MRFSVIIPVYNAEKTIINTLTSIVEQSFNDYEIIIINDGSTDKTDTLIKLFFFDKNLKYRYFITKNNGVSAARNYGWENAIGDFICFLDADDIWHPQKLEILNEILLSYDVCFLGHFYLLSKFNQQLEAYQVNKVNIIKYLLKNQFQTSCVCVKRNINMRFDESMSYCEDYDLFLNIIDSFNKSYYINLELTKLNRPQLALGGLSENRIEMRKGEITVYSKFFIKHRSLLFLLPIFIFWSVIKHIWSEINIFIR